MAGPLDSFDNFARSVFNRRGEPDPKLTEAFLRGTAQDFEALDKEGIEADGCYSRVSGDERGPFYLDVDRLKAVRGLGLEITRSREVDLQVNPLWAATKNELDEFRERTRRAGPAGPKQNGGDLK